VVDSVDPAEQQATLALHFAAVKRRNHRRFSWAYLGFFILFQALTIGAAAAATLVAVDETLSSLWRAAPAALATLGTSVLAAFQFRDGWLRHRRAARLLDYEILKFKNQMREYRPGEPRPQPTGVDVFLDRVESISRSGHQEADTKEEAGAAERQKPDAG